MCEKSKRRSTASTPTARPTSPTRSRSLASTSRRPTARFVVVLTDGYPDAGDTAIEEAGKAKDAGIEIVAIGTGDADQDYLRLIASTDEGSIFAGRGELVSTFGHIAKILAEGGPRLADTFMSTTRKVQKSLPLAHSASLRRAYDLAIAGAIGAVCGLFLYVEFAGTSQKLVQAAELWCVRDVLAGVTIGAAIGFFLNASEPFQTALVAAGEDEHLGRDRRRGGRIDRPVDRRNRPRRSARRRARSRGLLGDPRSRHRPQPGIAQRCSNASASV